MNCYRAHIALNEQGRAYLLKQSEDIHKEQSASLYADGCLVNYENEKATAIGVDIHHVVHDGMLCFVAYKISGSHDEENLAWKLLQEYGEFGSKALARHSHILHAIIYDAKTHQALVAGDRYGLSKIYYAYNNDCICFSNKAEILIEAGVSNKVSLQSIYDYIYFHVIPSPYTAFQDIHALEPGYALTINNGTSSKEQYWELVYTPGCERQAKELKDLFERCVARYARPADKTTGAFLSGGLDSSTISGYFQRAHSQPVPTFSIGFDEQGYDEIAYAKAAASHFGTDYHEYYVNADDVLEAVPEIVSAYSEPFGNSSAIPTYFCAKFARRHGIATLLAGDGGDELFGGNERYRKQLLLDKYYRLPAVLRSIIKPLLDNPLVRHIPLLKKIGSYVHQATIEMPYRMERYNLIERIGADNIFQHEFIAAVDENHPREYVRQTYNNIQARSVLNKMLGYDLKLTLVDNDLPKVVNMCHAAGVDVVFPYLDDEMMEFAAALPENQKATTQELRVFFRQAMSDFLPQEVLTKKKHGFGLPVGVWIQNNKALREFVYTSVKRLEGPLLKHGFCDDYFARYMSEHAPYYGTLLWVLMILSEWLAHNKLSIADEEK